MTVNLSSKSQLMLAILAMDAYNRGYNAGVNMPAGTQVGEANVGADSSSLRNPITNARLDQSAGFYAISYSFNDGTKVISYRGTDSYLGDVPTGGSDIWNGWFVGALRQDHTERKPLFAALGF